MAAFAVLAGLSFAAPTSAQTLTEALAAYERGDYSTAYRGFRHHAERGNAKAQAALGVMYAKGEGIPRDDAEAVRWYRRGASQGLAGAQNSIGVMYATGRGVPRDDAEAVRWFRRAAEQENAEAQANLGLMYEAGRGVPRDLVRAHKWFGIAASHMDASALLKGTLGMRRVGRRMTPGAIARAQRLAWVWQLRNHEVGSVPPHLPASAGPPPEAPRILNEAIAAYERGDYDTAYRGFRRHAEQGHAGAQAILGAMYFLGKGVRQSGEEAIRWLRRAAGQGHDGAQSHLGLIYEQGRGVPRDTVRAYQWYYGLAASASNATARRDAVQNMRRVGRRMTPGDVARAERLARARLLGKHKGRSAAPRPPLSGVPARKSGGDAREGFGNDR